MKVRVIASLVLALCLAVGSASASSIGVYFTADGTDCDATGVAPFTQVTFYILVHTYGDAATGGITGAEFQVKNFPSGWFGTPTPNPAFGTVIGNPLTGGCNIASGSCQSSPTGFINLFTVTAFATSAVSNVDLIVDKHTTPSNPNFQCPALVLCDAPIFTLICVSGGEAFLNGGSCTVAVQPTTWSKVKSLY